MYLTGHLSGGKMANTTALHSDKCHKGKLGALRPLVGLSEIGRCGGYQLPIPPRGHRYAIQASERHGIS